ncbi:MAG TPA: hypothetical protein VII99_07275, partial [Bacteroidia bacterium]
MNSVRKICVSVFILFSLVGFSQSSTPGGSVRLTVLDGGNVNFVFNTLSTLASGITYSNWTTLGITVIDNPGDNNPPIGVDDYTSWKLSVVSLDPNIMGANPVNTLPLSTIQVSASISAGCVTCNVHGSPFVALPAPGPGVVLVDG